MFLVAFALRAVYAYLANGPHAEPYSDSLEYHQVARNLATLGRFAIGNDPVRPTAILPPVMPLLTSLAYRVVGPSYFAGILLQCALGALVPLAVVRLGTDLYDRRIGRAAGWLSVFHPILVAFSGYLLTEASFTLMLTLAVIASVEWSLHPTMRRAFATGLFWGLAILTRPTVLLFPLIIAFWGWVALRRRIAIRPYLGHALLIAAGAVILILPWTIRNATVMHAFVPITTGSGTALFDSNNPIKWNDTTRGGGAVQVLEMEPYASKIRGLGEIETDKVLRAEAIEFLRGHVGEWPEMAAAKLSRFWRFRNEDGIWATRGSPLVRLVRRVDPLLIWSVVVIPLAIWGLARSLRGPRGWTRFLLLILILYFSALAAVFWGGLRPRVPIEPFVALLATAGFYDLVPRIRSAAHR